ncbi:autotransporter assembly complex protein TamA [Thalassospira povalilytica]|uniref:autotransporter assembly complex protein TamA n=1 Tax=Thalassospira povalilytica TaxID=732237 RepID=UPI001D1849E6|nr:outer membrane protein assembly factor [Thalassospira povalilytica]MCC4240980.1 outer membrane protein assembly factor [Thalassospira povalilytica]
MTSRIRRKFGSYGRSAAIVPLLMAGTMLAACSSDEGIGGLDFGFGNGESQAPADLRTTIPYEVELTGIDDHEEQLIEALNAVSTARRLQSRPTASRAGLQRRAEDDVERFQAVLRSNGFYDGQITFEITEKTGDDAPVEENGNPAGSENNENDDVTTNDTVNGTASQDTVDEADNRDNGANGDNGNNGENGDGAPAPLVLTYMIDTGAPYLIASVDLVIVRPDEVVERPATDAELERTRLQIGQRATAEPIILGEQFGVDILRDQGYPLVKATKRTVMADTAQKTISIKYAFETGPKANFGAVTVNGADKVDQDFIAGYRSWRAGEQYSPERVRETRRDLAQTNLFDSVIVKVAGPVGESGEIPVEINVVERKMRSIGGGVDFSTADGPGANAFWEHRNLFGAGERLRLGADASSLEQGLSAEFKKPQFLQRKQALVAEANAKNNDTDAYQGATVDSFVGVERPLGENWSTTLGVTAEYSDLTGSDSPNEEFYLAGLRGILRHDNTDNPLDPTRGTRFEINVSPYMGLTDHDTNFTSVSLSGSQYLSIDDDGDYVLAARARTGTIIGEERGNLPSNKRYYSGGGGSIRGYEYQKVGPLDDDHDPLGGRSVLELGFEFRARVTESFGVVPFVEGGNVYARSEPEDISLLWAAGLGFRYYTAVGPLRFDVAVPLDKRENVDDDYQFYISLGQAF